VDPILVDTILADPILVDPILVDPILMDPILVVPILVDPILAANAVKKKFGFGRKNYFSFFSPSGDCSVILHL